MAVSTFNDLNEHVGHHVKVNTYGTKDGAVYNVAIECMDCNTVLLDFDNEDVHPKQCGTCEEIFTNPTADRTCPNCGSGDWVNGYLDEPEPDWGEDPEFGRDEWSADAREGDTSLGYWDWVKHRKGFYKDNPQYRQSK
jgi:ribosomal protein S27AE